MPLKTSAEVTKTTLFPQEKSAEHRKHHSHYRCEHAKSERPEDRPPALRIVLPDQQRRDLTDVYRRDKDFTRENSFRHQVRHSVTPCPSPLSAQPDRIYTEQFFYVPCDCQTSPLKRFCQNLVNGVKRTVEFGLFITSAVVHRDRLVPPSYPFDQRSTFNSEMQQFNRLRDQCRQKSLPLKHTTTETYFSVH